MNGTSRPGDSGCQHLYTVDLFPQGPKHDKQRTHTASKHEKYKLATVCEQASTVVYLT